MKMRQTVEQLLFNYWFIHSLGALQSHNTMARYHLACLGLPYLLCFIHLIAAASALTGFRTTMSRVHPTVNLRHDVNRTENRASLMAMRLRKPPGMAAPFRVGDGDYSVQLHIGTPPRVVNVEIDTGSNLIWTQCKPCNPCFKQLDPLFDPSQSTSFAKLTCRSPQCNAKYTDGSTSCMNNRCEFDYTYIDDSFTKGYLATETFRIGSAVVPGITFGCGNENEGDYGGSSGILGLAGGKLSLISQLGYGKFSYCLQSDTRKANPLLFGSYATIRTGKVASTPLVKHNKFSVYSVVLTGITVGSKYIPIKNSPVKLKTNAAVVDSGTTFSYLLTPLIKQVKRAFIDQVKLPLADPMEIPGFDLCFKTGRWVKLPPMTLHFDGGAKMVLPQDNYFRSDPESKLLCMMIVRDRETNTIGNIMQMDMQIVYDLDNMRLSFAPTDCDNV